VASIRRRPDRPKPWEAVWRDPDGRQRTRTFTRKIDAQRYLTNIEADKLRGSYVDPHAGKITFRAFAEQWAASQTVDAKTREGTASRLRTHLVPTFGDMPLSAIRPSTVQQWLAGASRTLAPGTVRLVLATLSTIINAAVEDGLLASNPCRSRAVQAPSVPPGRVQPWTVEQVQMVVAALPHRYRATAVVAAGCGLRQGETFGLRVADVDFLRRRLEVRQQVKRIKGQGVVIAPPKRGKTREVPLPDVVAVAVAEHLRAYGAEDLVFMNTAGRPINRRSFDARTWKPAVIAAGLEPTRDNGFHALRHHYASVLLDAGVSIRALADYLGHTDPGFTLRVYTHLMPASEDRARQAVDAAFSREPGVSQAGT
jgi:integrase